MEQRVCRWRMGHVLAVLQLLLVCRALGEHSLFPRQEPAGEGSAANSSGDDSCSDYDVRLVRGDNEFMGLVEACYTDDNNTSMWGPICVQFSTWTRIYAEIVCRQLGLSTTTAVSIRYNDVPGRYAYTDLDCRNARANSLAQCGDFSEDIQVHDTCTIAGGVICEVPEDEQCEIGDARLVGGSNVAGRVEVCFHGVWGTVCRDGWDVQDAAVVCRQLGLNATYPLPESELRYGAGNDTQPILLREVECKGNEANISECNHPEVNDLGFCSHQADAGVICQAENMECKDTDIRLRGESGRTIEVCFTGTWGGICANHETAQKTGMVACRQLGFSSLVSVGDVALPDQQALLSGLNCSGSEKRLVHCDHDRVGVVPTGCPHVTVRCRNNETEEEPTDSSNSDNLSSILVPLGSTIVLVLLVSIIGIGVFASIFAYRDRTVRRKAKYNLERASHSPTIPDYTEMQGASNYLVPVRSRSEDTYAEWRDILNHLLLEQSQLTFINSLGEGCFGRVFKGTLTSAEDGEQEVAIKTLKDISSSENINDFVKESVLMLGFQHPNVLKLLGVCFDTEDGLPLIVLPYMANGDLKSFLVSKRGQTPTINLANFPVGLDQRIAMKMCLDITHGMEYLSTSSFVHRDLAARNCMVSGDLTVNIADFGLSRDVYSKDYYRLGTKTLLPVKWMAPESLSDNIFTVKSDVWSFGVVCWEVFSLGSTPYPGVDNHEISDYIADGRRLKPPKLCPAGVYEIMEVCWNEDPNERPTFSTLVQLFDDLINHDPAATDQPHYVNMSSKKSVPNGNAVQNP